MILEKLNRYVYEIDNKERVEADVCCFDKLLERFAKADISERNYLLSIIDSDSKSKIEEMVNGGIL